MIESKKMWCEKCNKHVTATRELPDSKLKRAALQAAKTVYSLANSTESVGGVKFHCETCGKETRSKKIGFAAISIGIMAVLLVMVLVKKAMQ